MKNILQILLLAFLFGTGYPLIAGSFELSASTDEKAVLVTDRKIYIVGEKIQFYASLINPGNIVDSLKSEVIYCELITPDGNKIVSGKFQVHESSAKGCMLIPADVRTGTYYLRAYTRLMRNYGPGTYAYVQIRIINPKKEEILTSENGTKILNPNLVEAKPGNLENIVSIVSSKYEYAPLDSITLSLHASGREVNSLQSICLKIVPEHSNPGSFLIAKDEEHTAGLEYFAETRGLSLNGKLTQASSTVPVGGKMVNLSIIGEGRDFMATRTDSAGRFYFALPGYYGKRDLFLCAEKTASTEMKIWVDNDFCTKPVNLPSPEFKLTNQEREAGLHLAINAQISSRYAADIKEKPQNEITDNIGFYGKPATVLYLDQYIQLPTLEECFNELPSSVRVRKHVGGKYFKVIGARDLSYYEPLVLIDWVAVDEPEKILAISPNAISRIEIVNEAYVKGNQTYGGIISIISKRGDFAGIDLPSTGIFINYSFLDQTPCDNNVLVGLPVSPDTRNTLLWVPGIKVKENSLESYTFKAPETPGNYSIILEGISKSGEILTSEKQIVVKN
jgi:hypothetical protein